MSRRSGRTLPIALATLAAGFLIAGLLWFLPKPGYSETRLALSAVIAVVGLTGAVGVVVDRPPVAGAGIVGLFLLGFWQMVLWMVIYPTIVALLFAVAIDLDDATESAPA